MAPPIPNGRSQGLKVGFPALLLALSFFCGTGLNGQTPQICTASATPLMVHSEGLAEPVGDIVINCSGGTAGSTTGTNITVALPTAITSRISAANNPNILLTVDSGSGPMPSSAVPLLGPGNTVAFNGVQFTVPASLNVSFRISNIRAAMNLLPAGSPVMASLSTSALSLRQSQVAVAVPSRGLLATLASTGISCVGSPIPATIDLANLFAVGSRFTSTRLSEGFATAFSPKDMFSDTGTRIVVSYSGFPAGARVFIPDVLAGSDAATPTAAGDLGGVRSGGAYAPSLGGTLLLARVTGSDSTGAGGSTVITLPRSATTFNSASEVFLTKGAGIAVYEVLDANPGIQESAQFATFVGWAPGQQNPVTANETISLGPVSTVALATAGDPIPRFLAVTPPTDCAVAGCDPNFFPMLTVDTQSLLFNTAVGPIFQTQYVRVNNTGGGFLNFTAAVTYPAAGPSGWLTTDTLAGSNNATLSVYATAGSLAPGVYTATLTIDAGQAGKRSIPVSLTVGPPRITVTGIGNAASPQVTALVPGSLATLFGQNFGGASVSVTFDGIAATVLFKGPGQINLQVPSQLAGKISAQMVITVDGNSSSPQTVTLSSAAPAIFGTLNQDNSLNSAAIPAIAGSVIQIFLTGLTSPSPASVTVKIHDQDNLVPIYAGGMSNGLQQVNVTVPQNLQTVTTALQICSVAAGSTQRVCSPQAPIAIRAAP